MKRNFENQTCFENQTGFNLLSKTAARNLIRVAAFACVFFAGCFFNHAITTGVVAQENQDKQSRLSTKSGDLDEASDATVVDMGDENKNFAEPVGGLPDWVKKGSYTDTDQHIEFLVVQSRECLKRREAEAELNEVIVAAVHQKVDEWFADGVAESIGIDLDYIRENLLQTPTGSGEQVFVHVQLLKWKVPDDLRWSLSDEKTGERTGARKAGEKDAYQCYALLALDQEFEMWAAERYEEQLVRSRTMQIGVIALSTFLLLSLVAGYFTAEHKTRGFYSRRLQSAALVLLLAIVATAVALSGMFPWL